MTQLYTYTIPVDDGAAPNPFHGLCTLAICKPGIRRTAGPKDWVAGLGSKNAPSGDLSGTLVYAMRVEEVLSLQEYDQLALSRWPFRIPDIKSPDLSVRLGDCIYDYSSGSPVQRPSVHGPENAKTDLDGQNVLVSRHFFYFGNRAVSLPEHLRPVCHQTQGHRSKANAPYVDEFAKWIGGLGLAPGQYGWPDLVLDWTGIGAGRGCVARRTDGEHDTST